MSKKMTRVQLLSLLSAGVIFFTTSCSVSKLSLKSTNIDDEYIDQKPYYQILKDSENFNVDMQVARNYNSFYKLDKYIRLKMHDDKPVVVTCDKKFEEREKEILKKVIDYYNTIFATINENYKFQFEGEYDKNSTIINFENRVIKGNPVGEARVSEDQKVDKGEYIIKKANILIDWEQIKDEEDQYIYAVMLHEFTHVLGLGDVYYNINTKNSSVIDKSTLMNTNNWGKVDYLFPNDYAILQTLYSKEYEKHGDYQKAVDVVNYKIQKYTTAFYKKYAQQLKEDVRSSGDVDREVLGECINWNDYRADDRCRKYTLEFIDETQCVLIVKDKNDNFLEKSACSYECVEGVVFIKDIYFSNANNYSYRYSSENSIKPMISIYKDVNSNYVVFDGTARSSLSKSLNEHLSRSGK